MTKNEDKKYYVGNGAFYAEESSEEYLKWLQVQGLAQQGKLEKIAGGCVVRRVLH